MARAIRRLRRVWVMLGLALTVVFVAWCLLAYRANDDGRRAVRGDAGVAVVHADGYWMFQPRAAVPRPVGLLFFAGSLVDARAYARLTHHVAGAGYPAVVVELPMRGAFGGAEGQPVLARGEAAMAALPQARCWVVGGHSRGGEVASRFVATPRPSVTGLLLVGTSHPRDISLASLTLPVTKLVGTRDGLASPERNERNRHNLPAHTRWVVIEGGNHSQFGDYGFQPGDRTARLPRERQHAMLVNETLRMLRDAAGTPACAGEDRTDAHD